MARAHGTPPLLHRFAVIVISITAKKTKINLKISWRIDVGGVSIIQVSWAYPRLLKGEMQRSQLFEGYRKVKCARISRFRLFEG